MQMNYEVALEHHLKHLEIADSVGQFVAHTNLGLMSASLGQKKAASYSYEQAIKCTVQVRPHLPAHRLGCTDTQRCEKLRIVRVWHGATENGP